MMVSGGRGEIGTGTACAVWIFLAAAHAVPGFGEEREEQEIGRAPAIEAMPLSPRDQAFVRRETPNITSAEAWQSVGPYGVGRLSDIAVHPTNDQTVYVGAATGGVYKTTNGGTSFSLLSNDWKSQSIGAIAVDPTNPNTVWVGLGEAFGGGGSVTYPGNGIMKSTDAGVTWKHMGLDSSFQIGRVSVHPTNSNIVFVAVNGRTYGKGTQRGVYRTLDGGATWAKVLYMDDSTGASDVRIHPTNPNRIFANFWTTQRLPYGRNWTGPSCRVHRSDNGGQDWKLLGTAEGLPINDLGKSTMDICKSNPNYMYMIYFAGDNTFKAVYRSIDGGMTWAPTATFPPDNMYSYYAHSFGQIRVNPHNPQEVIVFGIYTYRTTNGGSSWARTFLNNHVDHRAFSWSPTNANLAFLGDDGGFSVSTAGASGTFAYKGTQAVGGLSMAQIYNMDVAPDNANTRYAGFQDNFTQMTSDGGATWTQIIGGDGMNVRVDYGAPANVLGAYQDGNIFRSGSRGTGMQAITGYSGRGPWEPPIGIDSTNGMAYVGSEFVFRAPRGSNTFSRISNDLSSGDRSVPNYHYGTVSTLAAHNGTVWAGTDDGHVWVSKDGRAASPTWTKVRNGGAAGIGELAVNGWIKQITLDRSVMDGSVALIAISWYRWGDDQWKPSLYRVTNWGATPADWKDISGDLPPMTLTNMVVQDNSAARKGWYYAATDNGVYYSSNGGVNWAWLGGKEMPLIPVNCLTLHVNTSYLYAGTYGRGMWRINMGAITPVAIAGAGSFKAKQTLENHPNPVTLSTRVQFKVRDDQNLRVSLFDLGGRLVKSLLDKKVAGGKVHSVTWDRTDDKGRKVEAGSYILRVIGAKATLAKRVDVK